MKALRIKMNHGKVVEEQLPLKYTYLGGRGLTSTLINDFVPADCDPLGADNLLIFAPGLLCGSPMANTGRLSIGAKSPLTGGIKESNTGGTMAMALARLGIRAVVVEGKAPENTLYELIIDENGKARIEDASLHKGMGNYELAEKLLHAHGPKNAISSIGPAGEMLLSSASVQTTDPAGHPCRSAGRGGLGAVMGSKGLKALIVSKQGRQKLSAVDPDTLRDISRQFASNIKTNPWSGRVLPEFGTASILAGTNASGALPTKNAQMGHFEGAGNINGDIMAETIINRGGKTRHKGCSQCAIHCSNVYADAQGKTVTSALEYETIWAMGAMTLIDDLDAIARLDFLCDDMGLDTMNTGVALAVAMDANAIAFGDAKAAIKIVASIPSGTELGRLIGNGPDAVAKHFDHPRVPTVKGQSIAGYDPRAMPAMGVTYASSPMGADHTAGFVGGARGTIRELIDMSESSQIHMATLDSMGLCMFAQSGGLSNIFRAVSAITGNEFGNQEWDQLGTRIIRAELDFNRRAGLKREDDQLPAMFHEEPLDPSYETVPYAENDLYEMFKAIKD